MARKIYREEEYPTFEFIIDEDNKMSLSRVSLVSDPAIEIKGMAFTKQYEAQNMEIQMFSDGDKQIIAGPAMVPNKKILRKDDNGNIYYGYFSPQTIRNMVEIFNKNIKNRPTGVINDEHTNKMVDAYVLGSWIVEDSYYDKSRFYGFDLPKGTWFLEVKVEDTDFWKNNVKGQGKFGFSIEGLMGLRPTEFKAVKNDNEEWFDVLKEVGWLNVDENFDKLLKNINSKS